MNKSPAWKRQQLVLTGFITLLLGGLVWSELIHGPQVRAAADEEAIQSMKSELNFARRNEQLLEQFETDLEALREEWQRFQATMAASDAYRWAVQQFDLLQQPSGVNILRVAPPRVAPAPNFPRVPNRAAAFAITGTAYYHDFGRLVATIENEFPSLQIHYLELEPARFLPTRTEAEKLCFKMEFSILIQEREETEL